jgi:hypothetical protein
MPQLDFLIVTSQSFFLVLFFVGYLFFLKSILTLIAFEMKMKELVELHYLRWLDSNQSKLLQGDFVVLKSLSISTSLFDFLNRISYTKIILFGFLYGYNLLSLRSIYRLKSDNRVF